MSFVHQRSAGSAQVRSPGSAKNTLVANATMYAGLLGFWPICGMGTLKAGATIGGAHGFFPDPTTGGNNSLAMNDIWPNVYRTLTCVWTQDTGQVQTQVYQYQDCCDVPVVITTTTDPGWVPPYAYTGSPVVTATTFSQGYTYPPFFGVGTFAATLSNQWIASTGWAAKVGNALTLIAGRGLSTPTASAQTFAIFPVTYNTSLGNNVDGANLDAGYVSAAILGFPSRDFNFPPAFAYQSVRPGLHAILSVDSPTSKLPNLGGVIVLASSWILNGTGLGFEPSPAPNNKTIYAQKFDPSSFTMGAVVEPSPDFIANTISYPDPLTSFPVHVNFFPSDVLPNLVAGGVTGANYGIVGFRSAVL